MTRLREKQALSEELEQTKLQLSRCQRELAMSNGASVQAAKEAANGLRTELETARRRFKQLSQKQETEIRSLRAKIGKHKGRLEVTAGNDDIAREIESFARSNMASSPGVSEFIESLRDIPRSVTNAKDAVTAVFSAIRSFVAVNEEESIASTMRTSELEVSRLAASDAELRDTERRLAKARKAAARQQSEAEFLRDQINNEHQQFARFAKVFGVRLHRKSFGTPELMERGIDTIKSRVRDMFRPLKDLTGVDESYGSVVATTVSLIKKLNEEVAAIVEALGMDHADGGSIVTAVEEQMVALKTARAENERLALEGNQMKVHCDEMKDVMTRKAHEYNRLKEREAHEYEQKIDELRSELGRSSDDKGKMDVDMACIVEIVNRQKKRIKAMKHENASLAEELARSTAVTDEQRRRLSRIETSSAENQGVIDRLRENVKDVTEQLDAEKRASMTAAQNLKDSTSRIRILEEDARKQNDIRREETEVRTRQIASLEEEKERLGELLKTSKAAEQRLSLSLSDIQNERASLMLSQEQQGTVITGFEEAMNKTSLQNDELREAFDALKAEQSKIRRHVRHVNARNSALKDANNGLVATVEALERETERLSEADGYKPQLLATEKELKKMNTQVSDMKQAMSQLEREYSELSKVNERYKTERDGLSHTLTSVRSRIGDLQTATNRFLSSGTGNERVAQLIESVKPVLTESGISAASIGSVRLPTLSSITFRDVNIRPDPTTAMLTSEDKRILSDIDRGILSLPIDRSRLATMNTTTIGAKLQRILNAIDLARDSLIESEESRTRLTSLLSSQHSTIMQISRGGTAEG